MITKEIKNAIALLEYYSNGFHRLCGKYVKVFNLKEREDKYVADIILGDSEDETEERYDECEYSKELLEQCVGLCWVKIVVDEVQKI